MSVFLRCTGVLSLVLLLAACNGDGGAAWHQLGSADNCDAAVTTCRVSDGKVHVSLKLGPAVRALQPFNLMLAIEGGEVAAQSVVADFQMQGMDMGSNRYRLQRQQGGWQATVTLPVCSASRMDWRALIEFTLDGQPMRAEFPFHTEAN